VEPCIVVALPNEVEGIGYLDAALSEPAGEVTKLVTDICNDRVSFRLDFAAFGCFENLDYIVIVLRPQYQPFPSLVAGKVQVYYGGLAVNCAATTNEKHVHAIRPSHVKQIEGRNNC
jgi:hypothetical protein